jgi:hypothetical protein
MTIFLIRWSGRRRLTRKKKLANQKKLCQHNYAMPMIWSNLFEFF